MAATLVSSLSASPGSAGGTTSAINTTGATLIAIAIASWGVGPAPTLSDSKGNTYTGLTPRVANWGRSQIFYCLAPIVGTGHTFTVGVGTNYPTLFIYAYAAGTATFVGESGASTGATVTTLASGAVTPTLDGALIFAANAAGDQDATVDTIAPAGFSTVVTVQFASGAQFGGSTAWQIQTTAGAINPTWTFTPARSEVCATTAAFHTTASSGATEARVTQDVVEALSLTIVPARITQAAIELVSLRLVDGVVTQAVVEVMAASSPVLVTVPNVVGMTQAEATTAFTAAGLTLGTVTYATSSTVPDGIVISQGPAAGVSVPAGSTIDLVVAGPALVTVPNVVGMTQAEATTALTAAGLTLGTATNATSLTVPSGSVISQSLAAGASVAPGSAVDLVISTGPAGTARLPIIGWSVTTAEGPGDPFVIMLTLP